MDGAQAQQVVQLLGILVEQIEGPLFDYITGDFAIMIETLISELQLVEGVVMACCGCLIGWLAGNELLRCLW